MDALDLRYMKRVRFFLRSIGAWPSQDSATTKPSVVRRYSYTCFLFTICCVALVAQVMYLIKNKGVLEFIDLGQTCVTCLMSFVFIQRTTLPMQAAYQVIIKEFVTKFNLIHHRNKTEFSLKICKRVNYICEIASTVGLLNIYSCVFMFNMVPLYANYKAGMFSSERPVNGTFDLSVFYLLPFDQNDYLCYTLTCLYNWYSSYVMACMFAGHDLIICMYVFHIWGHLKICEHNLLNFPRPGFTVNGKLDPMRYSNEEMEAVAVELKEIIIHHKTIKEFVAKTSGTYSTTLLVYYGFHMVSDCIVLLECSTLDYDALAKYFLLTVFLYQQLIQLSVVFELVCSKGESLIDAVYSLPWECMDVRNRRTVLLFLQIVQHSLSVKAGEMVPVGVQTMVAILKASFSYFLMLKTFADN